MSHDTGYEGCSGEQVSHDTGHEECSGVQMSHDTGYVECRDCPLIFLSILSLSLGGLRLVRGFSLSWLSSDLSIGLGGRLTYNKKVILKVCIFTIRLCHRSSCLFSI